MQQLKWQFDKVTLQKIGKSALLVIAGTIVDFIANNLLQLIAGIGVPAELRPVTVSIFTWVINTCREWIKGEEGATI